MIIFNKKKIDDNFDNKIQNENIYIEIAIK